MMELKPCPFCGGEMTFVYNSFDNEFKFYHKYGNELCLSIEPIRFSGTSLADAREAWNRRAT